MAKPEIRLKGFKGEWESYLLSTISERYDNLRIPVKESCRKKGKIPYYGANGIQDYVDGFTHDGEYILIAEDGANDLTEYPVQYVNGKVWVNNHAHVICGNSKALTLFLKYAISCANVKSILVGGTRAKLTADAMMKLELLIPTKDEQVALAGYFKSLDSMILGVTKKIASLKQMKQACLVSMFPQAGETKPRVRFKGFKGEWLHVELSSIAKRITRKNSQLESTLPLTISAAEGLIEQTAFFNNVVASSNVSGYYLLKKGEFAYNKSYSNGYPFGAVKRLDRYNMGVLSTLYIVFSVDESVSSDYIVHFFDTSLWHKEVAMRAAEGARNHGLLNIGAEDFLDIDIFLPKDISEQQQIASFFTSLDKQISLQEARLEKLKQIKAACLDKMFV